MDAILRHLETHCWLVFTGESSFEAFSGERWCSTLSIQSRGSTSTPPNTELLVFLSCAWNQIKQRICSRPRTLRRSLLLCLQSSDTLFPFLFGGLPAKSGIYHKQGSFYTKHGLNSYFLQLKVLGCLPRCGSACLRAGLPEGFRKCNVAQVNMESIT